MPSNCSYKPSEDMKVSFDILYIWRVQKFSGDQWELLMDARIILASSYSFRKLKI